MTIDYDSAVAVTREIFWIGYYDAAAALHCNPYLLLDGDEAVIFDSGSVPDFPVIMRKVIDVIAPEQISYIVASHQDPDICGNIAVTEELISRPDLRVVANANTIRLIRHYGIRSETYDIDKHEGRLTLQSGRELEFIDTPYLHAPGAVATYDKSSKSLFSSDLFGALSTRWALFAVGDFIGPMEAFHRLYMPCNRVLRSGIARLRQYDIERILPQHGSILENEQIERAMSALEALDCGVDLAEQ